MKKRLLILFTNIFMCMFFSAALIIAADMPEEIAMESDVYSTHTKPIIKFTHAKHAEDYSIGCAECHHDYQDGKNIWKQGDAVLKCSGCHSEAKKAKDVKMSKEEQMKKYHYTAIHANCKGCHTALKKEGKDTGPTTCTKCHVK